MAKDPETEYEQQVRGILRNLIKGDNFYIYDWQTGAWRRAEQAPKLELVVNHGKTTAKCVYEK